MAGTPTCLVCQKEMVLGFMTDSTYAATTIPRWCEGTPKPGPMGSPVALRQAQAGLKVIAYRCPECHALRLYCPDES